MKVIIGTGPQHSFGAIVVDHRARCFWREGERIAMPTVRTFRFVAAVLCAWPRHVSHDDMVEHVYGEHPDCGPIAPEKTLRTSCAQHRLTIRRLGVAIYTKRGFGWRAYEPHEPGFITNYGPRSARHARTTAAFDPAREPHTPSGADNANDPGAGRRPPRAPGRGDDPRHRAGAARA